MASTTVKQNSMLKIFLFIFLTTLTVNFSYGQTPARIEGDWEGKLSVGLKLIFRLKETNGAFSTTLDVPQQGASNIPCDPAVFKGDSLAIACPSIRGRYVGKVSADGDSITGAWIQGASFSLTLKRMSSATGAVDAKKQTPRPPFNYVSEEVQIATKGNRRVYAGSLSYPSDGKPLKGSVLLISGSGAQDRDGSVGDHKPFAVIAHYLTHAGFAVLRLDDAGTGKTTGELKNLTTADLTEDFKYAVGFLSSHTRTKGSLVTVLGHSEGGIIASNLAAANDEIDGVILLAAPGVPMKEVMADQAESVLIVSGIDSTSARTYRRFYENVIALSGKGDLDVPMEEAIMSEFAKWRDDVNARRVSQLLRLDDSLAFHNYVNTFSKQISSKWLQELLKINPAPTLKKIKCAVLAVAGEKDVQVLADKNLKAIDDALRAVGNTNVTVKLLPGLNHLFQTCIACTPAEYFVLEESFSPIALALIEEWLVGRSRTHNKTH